MSDDKECFQTLIQLGLTNSQAKVYLSMAKLGTGKAKAIWQLSGVARQDLYRILLDLQKAGLVERVVAAPSEFRAIPLAEGVSILFQRKRNEVSDLQTMAKKIVKDKCHSQKGLFPEEYQCIMIPEKETLALRINESMDRAQRSVDVSSSWKRLSISLYKYKYAEALVRGVQVRVIVNTEDESFIEKIKPSLSSKPNFEARWMPHSPTTVFACLDERETYISTKAEAGLENACMLWSNYPTIVALVHNYFETQWKETLKNKGSAKKRKFVIPNSPSVFK